MAKARRLASRLRHRIDIARLTEAEKATGGYTTTLVPIASGVAAEVISLTGSEAVKEKLLQGIRVYRITIRWRAGVAQTDQVVYGADTLNIRSAVDPKGDRRELVILADTNAVRTA